MQKLKHGMIKDLSGPMGIGGRGVCMLKYGAFKQNDQRGPIGAHRGPIGALSGPYRGPIGAL